MTNKFNSHKYKDILKDSKTASPITTFRRTVIHQKLNQKEIIKWFKKHIERDDYGDKMTKLELIEDFYNCSWEEEPKKQKIKVKKFYCFSPARAEIQIKEKHYNR